MKGVNAILTNLESLKIHYFDEGDDMIFKNVKHLDIYGYRATPHAPIHKLSFPILQSVELDHYCCSFDGWVAFFRRHQSIEKLFFHTYGSDFDMIKATFSLSNLSELIVDAILSVDDIIQLIVDHPKLMKLKFINKGIDVAYLEGIQKEFGTNWNIENDEKSVSLERKTVE